MLSIRAELARASARAARAFSTRAGPKPFKKLLAANRGEIATRILRAGTELDLRTVAIYSQEDRYTAHRYKADQAFRVGRGQTPVGAYLDIESIVRIAKHNDVDCVHPGYGLLSERTDFAAALEAEGIAFVGPTVAQLQTFGDKTAARTLATSVGVPLVPGTNHAVTTAAEARAWIEGPGEGGAPPVGYPVIIKAAMGGGGRGMRVVERAEDLEEAVERASSEALAAFGDGAIFIERCASLAAAPAAAVSRGAHARARLCPPPPVLPVPSRGRSYVKDPRHIEVQILGDGTGDVVHLFDRDCSVQRRHQKVVETAPAVNLPPATREAMFADAKRLTSVAKYRNAGTVEFLVAPDGAHYFIEVNPELAPGRG